MISLRQRTPTSFECLCPIEDVASYLREQRFIERPVTNPTTEYARLQKQRALVVIYKSGTVLIQGGSPQIALELLNPFTTQAALF